MRAAITLTTVRRPDVLEHTLTSFATHLDPGWPVGPVFINLDPAMGDADAQNRTRAVIDQFFPAAEVHIPQTPGFGAAVKRLWQAVPDGPVLHLEDDWTCVGRIDLLRAAQLLDQETRMVSFLNTHHGRKGQRDFSETEVKTRYLGGLVKRRHWVPLFNTGPALADGAFLRDCAERLDPDLDPEKQMRRPLNPPLNDWLDQYKCRFLKTREGGHLLEDTGRAWRTERGIEKHVADGRSTWNSSTPEREEQ